MSAPRRLAYALAMALPFSWVGGPLAAAQAAGSAPAGTPAAGASAATGATAAGAAGAPAFEPYRFNARERTARALAAWDKGQLEEVVAPLDSALRLQPGDPLVEYNAGTAHLGAKQADAAELLERAAKHAPPALAADAHYNLGNARLDAKDARRAIDAYKGALRAQPGLPGAQRNLELALRMLEEQQQKDRQQNDSKEQKKDQQGDPNDPNDPNNKNDSNDSQGKPQPDPQGEPQQTPSQPDLSQPGPPQPGEQQQPPQERPLPQFEDQKDMTAEQAAAILQAVENLERQQRREQARALARAKTSVEKDW